MVYLAYLLKLWFSFAMCYFVYRSWDQHLICWLHLICYSPVIYCKHANCIVIFQSFHFPDIHEWFQVPGIQQLYDFMPLARKEFPMGQKGGKKNHVIDCLGIVCPTFFLTNIACIITPRRFEAILGAPSVAGNSEHFGTRCWHFTPQRWWGSYSSHVGQRWPRWPRCKCHGSYKRRSCPTCQILQQIRL